MYRILAAIGDDEERALEQARTITGLPGVGPEVSVTLFHDFTDNPEGASVHQVAAVRRAAEHLEDEGVEVGYAESSGAPAEAILETAADIDADLLCLAPRGRSPTGKALFGSVTQQVLLEATRPALVLGAGREKPGSD
ncbi:universal stress protein [Halorussus salilacus]|uniref:universal stress protein n=1 Tax=Halorussus salilacus TaxID=2953750 RepID=UPI00209D9E0C|nr:universal stress protein [Halorussus salilacus]USZ66967.1 universal stress protein [Halorussus salilacus]